MKNTWKKAAAFTLALALVAGAAPANVGTGGLFGGSAIVANAATTVTTIDQLKNASGSVVIGADIEYSEYTFWYYEKNNVDIDLNGHTITLAKAYFGVDNGHTLTIRDSKGDGKILMKRQVRVLNGNVILEGGTLESNYNSGAIGISKGTFTMNGGTITGPKSIQCRVDGSVIINGGNVNGEFNGTGTGLSITGGIFNFDVTSLVNAGVSVTKIGNLWYVGDSAPSIVDISNATVNLAADNSVESITVGDDTITDLSGFDITYGVSDTDHTATSVPTAAGTYYAYVTPKTTNTAYTGTAKSAEITVAAKFTNASVTLGDDLALNFYLDGIADATAAAEYTVKFEGECVDKTAALAYNATEDKYYATTHVYAKNINQPITAQLYKGEEAVGAPIVTSISDYLTALKTPLAAKMAANPTNPDALTADEKKLLAMVSAAQLFGDASAAYFNPTETVNDTSVAAEITAYMTQANISDAALTAMAAQYAPTFGSDDALLSLVLDSKTAARLYVKGDTTGAESNFSSTKADYPTYHEVTGLLPQNLADEQTITVGGTDYKFSALSWCYRVLSSTSASQKNVNMAKAIMAYYTAAKAYTAPANPYAANSVGDVVAFGNYNWYIIGKSDNGVTLLMQTPLTTNRAYNDSYTGVTWETCSLRTYLNEDFYNSFSADDKAKIAQTHNSNPNNPDYSTSGGNETDDYIYLLSIAEANALDSSIRANGSWWWLRSPGYLSNRAAVVIDGGYVNTDGYRVDFEYGVRPALNLKF